MLKAFLLVICFCCHLIAAATEIPKIEVKSHGVLFEFICIPAGTYAIGAEEPNFWEEERSFVSLSEFALMTKPVTQMQWQAVMKHNPSFFKHPGAPVDSISYYDALSFVEKINYLFYRQNKPYRVRPPISAEWEVAARAGGRGPFPWNGNSALLSRYAWWGWNSSHTTHPVGEKLPNSWGFYDMIGNVGEWTSTSRLPGLEGPHQIVRGGCWAYVEPEQLQVATSGSYDARVGDVTVGLRLALDYSKIPEN